MLLVVSFVVDLFFRRTNLKLKWLNQNVVDLASCSLKLLNGMVRYSEVRKFFRSIVLDGCRYYVVVWLTALLDWALELWVEILHRLSQFIAEVFSCNKRWVFLLVSRWPKSRHLSRRSHLTVLRLSVLGTSDHEVIVHQLSFACLACSVIFIL